MELKDLAKEYRNYDNRYRAIKATLDRVINDTARRRDEFIRLNGVSKLNLFEENPIEKGQGESVNIIRKRLEEVRNKRMGLRKELEDSLTESLGLKVRID